jgi:hypothetical protein
VPLRTIEIAGIPPEWPEFRRFSGDFFGHFPPEFHDNFFFWKFRLFSGFLAYFWII